MQLVIRLLFTLLALTMINASHAQQTNTLPPATIPNTTVQTFHSAVVSDDYTISVALPADYFTRKDSFPVLYVTDANLLFATVTQMQRLLQRGDAAPEMVIIGIGYASDSLSNLLRSRDYTPTVIPDSMSFHLPTGGAPQFLRFIREELMPFINKTYRVTADANFAGVSYGGLFGLYTLFHEPATFRRYIIASPSIWFDNAITLQYETQYARTHHDLNAKVFLCAGSLEQTKATPASNTMVTNVQLLAEQLQKRHYPHLNLQTHIFTDEMHSSIAFAGFSRGLRVVFKQ